MIEVTTAVPGAREATILNAKLRQIGIQDVQFFHDSGILPRGMWAVVQVQARSSSLILPSNYHENNVQPYIMWWCKTNDGNFRLPNDQDLMDILAVRKRAEVIWEKGEGYLADELDKQSAEKDEKHRQKLRDTVHDIAPAMKKAIHRGDI